MLKTQDIRRNFLNYFKSKNHAIIPSSSVVPHDDPSLLFINAGMNQFKDVFLGTSIRDYTRATTSQKCIRVGGKHNDLENVGHTTRHLTFFEMLGNFSFGDYFKKDAIEHAWYVATNIFELDPEKIWPTIYLDDDEAFELWKEHVPANRIVRFGEKENFWAMGDTGPCGPCSELLYDRGEKYGTAKSPLEDASGERYLEFWNLVFMQYNRSASGILEPLPKPSIDTGAGLERIMSLKLGVDSVFETDLLRSLIAQVENISKVSYDAENAALSPAFRVIADHLRCLSFAIADGAQPSNVDRGYVLRKVLRRAVRYGRQLGMEEPFLAKVLPRLISEMGDDYRELHNAKDRISEILTAEEEAFMRTLKRGGNILNQIVGRAIVHGRIISGDDAFKLKDTYGLPLDEITLLAKDAELSVDINRYDELEQEAKVRSRSAQKNTQQVASENFFADFVIEKGVTQFIGYIHGSIRSPISGLVVDGQFVDTVSEGQEAMVILECTSFYAEMGGQVGDTGELTVNESAFTVTNTIAPYKGVIAHVGKVEQGNLKVGDLVAANIDKSRRLKIANNHTATHLLHWALHEVLGEHVKQAGSVVDAERLRFDFSHHKALTEKEIVRIEDLVNSKIRTNKPVESYEITYEEAQKRSEVKQFFGEKYGSKVRVVDIDFSKELCGGTHTSNLGNIGLFRIVKEGSIAAGVRRIEAVTGSEAEAFSREAEHTLSSLATHLKTQPSKILERVEKLLEENKLLVQELKTFKKGSFDQVVEKLAQHVETLAGKPVLAAKVDFEGEDLKLCADALASKFPTLILVLAAAQGNEKCQVLVRVSDDCVSKGVKASEIIKAIAPIVEGSGGGKPNSAQAGGKAPQNIEKALEKAKELILSL